MKKTGSIQDVIANQDKVIQRLREQVKNLARRYGNAKGLNTRQRNTIKKLSKQLASVERVNNALFHLQFAAKKDQPKSALTELNRAMTMRRKAFNLKKVA